MRTLIVVAHGSRKKESALEVAALVDRMKALPHAFDLVTHAFLQFSDPLLPGVIDAAVAQGSDEIVVFPYFIAAGSHVLQDIPDTVENACKVHPGVKMTISRHLGLLSGVPGLILSEVN